MAMYSVLYGKSGAKLFEDLEKAKKFAKSKVTKLNASQIWLLKEKTKAKKEIYKKFYANRKDAWAKIEKQYSHARKLKSF